MNDKYNVSDMINDSITYMNDMYNETEEVMRDGLVKAVGVGLISMGAFGCSSPDETIDSYMAGIEELNEAQTVYTEDINNDGKDDFAIKEYDSDPVGSLFSHENPEYAIVARDAEGGGLQGSYTFVVVQKDDDVGIGDVNGDTVPDVAVKTPNGFETAVISGDDGSFSFYYGSNSVNPSDHGMEDIKSFLE